MSQETPGHQRSAKISTEINSAQRTHFQRQAANVAAQPATAARRVLELHAAPDRLSALQAQARPGPRIPAGSFPSSVGDVRSMANVCDSPPSSRAARSNEYVCCGRHGTRPSVTSNIPRRTPVWPALRIVTPRSERARAGASSYTSRSILMSQDDRRFARYDWRRLTSDTSNATDATMTAAHPDVIAVTLPTSRPRSVSEPRASRGAIPPITNCETNGVNDLNEMFPDDATLAEFGRAAWAGVLAES